MWGGACLLKQELLGPKASQVVLVVKKVPANAGDIRDPGLIPRLGRFLGGGHGHPLQFSRKSHGQRSLVGYSP